MKKRLLTLVMSIAMLASFVPSAMASIDDGLVGHWTFDAAKTSLYSEVNKDDWGLATIGTATAGKTGKVGTSYQVTRNKIAATLGNVPEVMNTGEMTVSFWVNSNRSNMNTEQNVFTIGGTKLEIMMKGDGSTKYGGGVYATSGGVGLHSNGNDSTTTGTISSPAASVDTWYHIVMTLKYGENGTVYAEAYQDGVHTGGRKGTSCSLKTTDLTGSAVAVGSTSNGLAGFVDELRVYNRILTEAEIAELYSLDYAAVHNNPTAEWSFTDGSIEDSVGTYEWNEVAGAKTTINVLGFANEGLKLSEDTSETGEANVFDVTLPAKMTSFTINTWVKRDELTGSEQRIFQAIDTTNSQGIFTTFLHDGSLKTKLCAQSLNDSKWNSGTGGSSLTEKSLEPKTGEWHMITTTFYNGSGTTNAGATKNGFYLKTYYDGQLVLSPEHTNRTDLTGYANILNSGTIIRIGGGFDNTQNFRGTFDNVAIWNSVLSAEDVAKLYASSKKAAAEATDASVNLVNGKAIGTDNAVSYTVTGVADSTADYTADSTVNKEFKNDMLWITNIPAGLYVSNVTSVAAENLVTITFAGELSKAATAAQTIKVFFMPYGTYNANSDAMAVSVNPLYDLQLQEGAIAADTKIYTGTVVNNAYAEGSQVDAVVAIYDGTTKTMKDAYLSKDITVPAVGETITVTSDALDYADGDIVKLFVFESIETIKPVNALLK